MSDTTLPSYTCPFCGMVSYHPKDIEHRFCARCDKFEDEPRPIPAQALRDLKANDLSRYYGFGSQ